ncbi:uncharacterized protein LOC143282402 [Babylonia areolata]|uniref:uncharacterized protein LOC143282402 n=1 Tax=Babylonia areolata TaxID=304850 RepID=UPI003FD1A091
MERLRAVYVWTMCLHILHVVPALPVCRLFHGNDNTFYGERGSSVNVTFSISNKICRRKNDGSHLESLTVFRLTTAEAAAGGTELSSMEMVYCQWMHHVGGACTSPFQHVSCSCEPETREYTMHVKVTDGAQKVYEVVGLFSDGVESFRENFTVSVVPDDAGVTTSTDEDNGTVVTVTVVVVVVVIITIPVILFAVVVIIPWYKRARANRNLVRQAMGSWELCRTARQPSTAGGSIASSSATREESVYCDPLGTSPDPPGVAEQRHSTPVLMEQLVEEETPIGTEAQAAEGEDSSSSESYVDMEGTKDDAFYVHMD